MQVRQGRAESRSVAGDGTDGEHTMFCITPGRKAAAVIRRGGTRTTSDSEPETISSLCFRLGGILLVCWPADQLLSRILGCGSACNNICSFVSVRYLTPWLQNTISFQIRNNRTCQIVK